MSSTWMLSHVRVAGALIDYAIQVEARLAELAEGSGDLENMLLKNFVHAYLEGTIGIGGDPLGLYWRPRTYNAARSGLKALERVAGWLFKKNDSYGKGGYSKTFQSAPFERIRKSVAQDIKNNVRLLHHLPGRKQHIEGRMTSKLPTLSVEGREVCRFPDRYLWPMLFEGFRLRSGEVDEAPSAIANLIILGGLRESEPLNLWVQDLEFSERKVFVALRHPRDSLVVGPDGLTRTRLDTLRKFFRTEPRCTRSDLYHAGWKGVKGDMGSAIVHWLPIEGVSEHVHDVLYRYATEIRPAIMRLRRSAGLPDHPFLFVSSGRAGSEVGSPYTLSALLSAWERSVCLLRRKYDDQTLQYGKSHGTTPHGGRHFYGNYISSIFPGNEELIQHCMHHLSPFSQRVYTRKTASETDALLQTNTAKAPEFQTVVQALETQRRGGMRRF